jgi:hypothetical protein
VFRQWLAKAWAADGVLHRRWEELRTAPQYGWHGMANWIKTALVLVVGTLFLETLDAAGTILVALADSLGVELPKARALLRAPAELWSTVDLPMRAYFADLRGALPASPQTLYTYWQITGAGTLFATAFTRTTGFRLVWWGWSAATAAVVWAGTLPAGRPLAAGITVLGCAILGAAVFRRARSRRSVLLLQVSTAVSPQIVQRVPSPASESPRPHPCP